MTASKIACRIALLVFAFHLTSTSNPALAETAAGSRVLARVVRVIDGDTLEVEIHGEFERIRLAEIDAPEQDQPWGVEAGAALRGWVEGEEVELVVLEVDRYRRLVCTVYLGERNINRALAEQGHAWAYTDYAKDLSVIALEKQARVEGRGLWSLPESARDAPWEWRRARRAKRTVPHPDPRCAKRTCREMTDCEEARYHLSHCGLTRLDGDGDGTPCEQLCRGSQ